MGEKDRLPFSSWRLTIFTLLCKYFLCMWCLYLLVCLCLGTEARGWRQVSFFDHLHPLFFETGSLRELEVPNSTKTAWSWASRICLCPSPSHSPGVMVKLLCAMWLLLCFVLFCFALLWFWVFILVIVKSHLFWNRLDFYGRLLEGVFTLSSMHMVMVKDLLQKGRNQYLRPMYIILWTNLEEGF